MPCSPLLRASLPCASTFRAPPFRAPPFRALLLRASLLRAPLLRHGQRAPSSCRSMTTPLDGRTPHRSGQPLHRTSGSCTPLPFLPEFGQVRRCRAPTLRNASYDVLPGFDAHTARPVRGGHPLLALRLHL